MTDLYVSWCRDVARPDHKTPISGPSNPISNEKLATLTESTDSGAAPDGTLFAVVTFAAGGGFVEVGLTPTAVVDDSRYRPEGVPSVVQCKKDDVIAAIKL